MSPYKCPDCGCRKLHFRHPVNRQRRGKSRIDGNGYRVSYRYCANCGRPVRTQEGVR